jgi:hypothetical protein
VSRPRDVIVVVKKLPIRILLESDGGTTPTQCPLAHVVLPCAHNALSLSLLLARSPSPELQVIEQRESDFFSAVKSMESSGTPTLQQQLYTCTACN